MEIMSMDNLFKKYDFEDRKKRGGSRVISYNRKDGI